MYIKVKVTPGAKKETFQMIKNDTWEVAVREKAERNMANERVRALLSENFNLPVGKIRLVTGAHSRSKIFDIAES